MTNLQLGGDGNIIIDGTLVPKDQCVFVTNDDKMSIQVLGMGAMTDLKKYDEYALDGDAFDSMSDLTDWIQANAFAKQSGGGGAAVWGSITGNVEDQADLQAKLDAKQAASANLTAWAGVTPASKADASALAAKANASVTITGTGALTGGGSMASNRTIDASAATKASLAKADTAVQPAAQTTAINNATKNKAAIVALTEIADPATATAEDLATAYNALLAALKA